ncbi:TIGR02444 family protein [Phenylobacterium sp.]|uniref:TIGR02444 family protein n=1 Tax=Phenylobacterium sp. TaxID=1871053 RepID=UPI0035647A17
MALWDWTLEAYAQPGVPEATLTLQDQHGQNTSLLLWAVWAETADPELLARAADVARRWEGLALAPVRAVRRALKPTFDGVDDGDRERLREDVKAVELRAERVLMEALEAMTGSQGGAHALAALEAASKAWGKSAPADALAALAAALG